MTSVIRVIMLGALLQITVVAGLIVYLFNHTNDMALQYAQLAESNAHSYTDESLRKQYNTLQVERHDEREDMRIWVDRRIDLKVSQALREGK